MVLKNWVGSLCSKWIWLSLFFQRQPIERWSLFIVRAVWWHSIRIFRVFINRFRTLESQILPYPFASVASERLKWIEGFWKVFGSIYFSANWKEKIIAFCLHWIYANFLQIRNRKSANRTMIFSPGTKRKITKRPIVSHNAMEGRSSFLNTEDTETEWSSMNGDIWVSFSFSFDQAWRVEKLIIFYILKTYIN